MTDSPKLARVISCYNYESFVDQCVLDQSCDDCEVAVVDDGSTYRSWEVISRPRVRAFRINNSGQRAACLFGLDRTQLPFVLVLDADDELKPGALGVIIDRHDPGAHRPRTGQHTALGLAKQLLARQIPLQN